MVPAFFVCFSHDFEKCRNFVAHLNPAYKQKISHESKVQDNILPVIEEVNQSDGLVLTSPIFYGRWTGQMQTFIERFTFPWVSYEDLSITPQRKMPVTLIYNTELWNEEFLRAFEAGKQMAEKIKAKA